MTEDEFITRYSDDLYEELSSTVGPRPCVQCGGVVVHEDGRELAYDNALIVTLKGGYGMFCDPQNDDGFLAGWTVLLCHDCAHAACDALPWLKNIIDPAGAHSHSEKYREANPDHYGWDYDMAAGTFYTKLAAKLFIDDECVACKHGERAHSKLDCRAVWLCNEKGCGAKCMPN